jgi:hypothetical protein
MKIGNRPVSGLYFAGESDEPTAQHGQKTHVGLGARRPSVRDPLLLCTPISANLFRMFFFEPPQNRHPGSL